MSELKKVWSIVGLGVMGIDFIEDNVADDMVDARIKQMIKSKEYTRYGEIRKIVIKEIINGK